MTDNTPAERLAVLAIAPTSGPVTFLIIDATALQVVDRFTVTDDWEGRFRYASAGHRLIEHGYMIRSEEQFRRGTDAGWTLGPQDCYGTSVERIALPSTHADQLAEMRAAGDMFRRPDTPPRFPEPNWLIWSHEHGGWWRPFERGYTGNLAEAGRYLHPRAYQICRDANAYGWVNGLPKEVMIEATSDPQVAATAVQAATAALIAERDNETIRTTNKGH